MENIVIKIKGMHCKSCSALIEDALLDEDGVLEADVSVEDGAAAVRFDETKVSEARLKALVRELGYEVG